MRTICLLLLLVVAVAANAQGPTTVERPRLVVLCSVDQLARWVFQASLPHMGKDGFRRLQREGTDFVRTAYQHACTETGPGHATLSTGAPASVHGIVRNAWYDRQKAGSRYCVDDPSAQPLSGMAAGAGIGPARLLAPTLGDVMKAHLGVGAKVASLSWKDRSAVLMAGRAADIAAWMDRGAGVMVTNQAYAERIPRWLDEFNGRRELDDFWGWTWKRAAPPDAYVDLVDDRPFEGLHENGSRARYLPQPVTGGGDAPGPDFYLNAYYSPVANEHLLLAAMAAVDGMELGGDVVPDLLCIGFSANDAVGHRFGPGSVETRDTLLRTDRLLSRLLRFLDDRVGVGRYLFLLSSDHGIGPIPEAARRAGVDAGRAPIRTRARAAAERALRQLFGTPTPPDRRYVNGIDGTSLYLDHTLLPEGQRLRAARHAAAAADGAPGVGAAYATADVLSGDSGLDPVLAALRCTVLPGRCGDIVFVSKPYWIDGTTPATHGSPYPYDREVPFLAMGPGVRRGHRCSQPVSPGIGAVLAAHLMGIPAPSRAVDELPADVIE